MQRHQAVSGTLWRVNRAAESGRQGPLRLLIVGSVARDSISRLDIRKQIFSDALIALSRKIGGNWDESPPSSVACVKVSSFRRYVPWLSPATGRAASLTSLGRNGRCPRQPGLVLKGYSDDWKICEPFGAGLRHCRHRVPEPASMAPLGFGMMGRLAFRRRTVARGAEQRFSTTGRNKPPSVAAPSLPD